MRALNKNIKLILNYVVGPLVFCILAFSIYNQLIKQPDWRNSISQIADAFHADQLPFFLIVLFCMLLNWGIEARKWQVALTGLHRVPFHTCFRAIFTGTTLAFFTPNRTGEYFGRILYLPRSKRLQAIPLTIVCSMAQLIITLAMGSGGMMVMREHVQAEGGQSVVFWYDILLTVVIVMFIILLVLYFRLRWLVKTILYIPKMARLERYMSVLINFNATLLIRILSLSGGRFLVFIAQYFLLFNVFEVDITWWQCLWSLSSVFLIVALIPNIAVITELGIRWKASIEIVQIFSSNFAGILAASLVIWIVNLVIPALIGSLLILGIRLYRNGTKELAAESNSPYVSD